MKHNYILDDEDFLLEVATTQDVNDLLQTLHRLKKEVNKVYYKGNILYIDHILDFIESNMQCGQSYKMIISSILSKKKF